MIGRGSCVWSQLLSLGCLCASMGLSLAMPAGWAVASARAPRVLGSADRRAQRAVEARSDGSQGELETRRRFTSFASSSSRGNVVSRSGRNGRLLLDRVVRGVQFAGIVTTGRVGSGAGGGGGRPPRRLRHVSP